MNEIQKVCGVSFHRSRPQGDTHDRSICTHCGFIHYENPKPVTGVVCKWENQYLLCRRAIEPRKNFWTFPAGFMELGETAQESAKREAFEEAGADVRIDELIGLYTLRKIGQIHIFFRGELLSPSVNAGTESLEVSFFSFDEIPWNEIAFSTVASALRYSKEIESLKSFQPHYEVW